MTVPLDNARLNAVLNGATLTSEEQRDLVYLLKARECVCELLSMDNDKLRAKVDKLNRELASQPPPTQRRKAKS